MSQTSAPDMLEDVHDTIASVHHDLNNPLSIISGNAQFLIELSREEDVDGQVSSSAEDIQKAAQRISDSMHRLAQLKEQLEAEL